MMALEVTKKTNKKPAPVKEGRKKSKLTQVGDEAKREAEAKLLLATLRANDWNLSATARVLDLGAASSVIRAIRACGLDAEYEKHRV
jgi:transcriptional regulator with GAF, ATPase, and Fis domain